MSQAELAKVEVLARVKSGDLPVADAAALRRASYRQAKRLWKRCREEGAAGMKHRGAGRRSNRAYAESLRRKVLRRVREKCGGEVGERFDPTRVAEHPPGRMGFRWTRRRCGAGCSQRGCGAGSGSEGGISSDGSARSTLTNWCRWT